MSTVAEPSPRRRHRRRATAAPYQAGWGGLTTTLVSDVYAIAFLARLLTARRLSDQIGRRPVLLAGIDGQVLALAVFVDARSAVRRHEVVDGYDK